MGSGNAVNTRYEGKFAHLLEEIAARSVCLVGPGHRGDAIRGHLVPASKLRLIAAPRGRRQQAVVTFDLGLTTLQGRAAGKLPPVRKKRQHSYAGIDGDSLTRPFACADHDNRLFEPIDGPDFDLGNPTHCALVSYRTLLWLQYEALSFARALGRIQSTPEFRALPPSAQRYERVRLGRRQVEAGSLGRRASELHREAVEGEGGRFAHRTIRLLSTPKLAFAGACARGGGALWTAREREVVPLMTGGVREAVPFVLTCYPDPEGHIVVASCPSELADLLPVVFPAFREAPDDREALLSASALDLVDQIMIAPSIWDGYGEDRQRGIWDRYTRMPEGPRDALADIDIAPLNLFA